MGYIVIYILAEGFWREFTIEVLSIFINVGGMILLNKGGGEPLQYAATSAFLANLFADYLTASGVPGFYCGPNYIPIDDIRSFATSQVSIPLLSSSALLLQ